MIATMMPERSSCMTRRRLLVLGGTAVTVLATFSGASIGFGQSVDLVLGSYPARRLMRLAELKPKTPVEFDYPTAEVKNFIVSLGERAGGGIGTAEDVVAFNTVCPHMGGPVGPDTYKPDYAMLGPCPMHLSTFDLTKYGMVVSGHASDSLPQVALELRGEDIYAVGVLGLIYGYSTNPQGT